VVSLNPFDRGKTIPVLESREGLADGGSLALAQLKRGAYKVEVTGGGSTGKWQLDVFLPGDVDGDFKVTSSDVDVIRTALVEGYASPELLEVADSNRDGIITIFDVDVAQANRGTATSVRPLTLTAGLAEGSDTGVVGDNLVRGAQVDIVGLTLPRALVSVDADGDGFDDGLDRASPHAGPTNFEIDATLKPGVNPVRVRAADNFGQVAFSELTVTLDAVAPTVVSTSPAHLATVDAEFDEHIPVQVVFSEPMIASTLLAGLVVTGNRTDHITPVAPTYDSATNTLRFEIDRTLPDTSIFVVVTGAMDLAGNQISPHEFEFRRRIPPSAVLTEADFFSRRTSIPVHFSQSAGRRTLSFDLALFFDTTDQSASLEDTLYVYLVHQATPWIPLFDGMAPGTPVFSVSANGADYDPDLVTFDGTTVEIDVTALNGEVAGLLQLELYGEDSDRGSRARVGLNVQIESQ
jgi:hypothetical protein